MAVTDYKLSSAITNEARVDSDDTGWTDLSNAETDDSNYATNTITKDSFSNWLRANTFAMGVPAGATIDGIEVQIKHDDSSPTSEPFLLDSALYLRKVTTGQVGDNYANTVDQWDYETPETFTYGGSTDKWGTTWSVADVNNTGFGLDFAALSSGAESDHTADIYFVKIRVYYTASGGSETNMQINIGDTFKDVDALQINIGDSWKAVTSVKQNIGDSWKDVF